MLIPTMGEIPYEARNTYLCVDEYRDGEISGRFYSAFEEVAVSFHSLMALMRYIDELLDQTMFSQRYEERRALLHVSTKLRAAVPSENWKDFSPPPGALATFSVRIQFRQNATWQGEVVWIEQKRSSYFRSALELLRMVDDVLLAQNAAAAGSASAAG